MLYLYKGNFIDSTDTQNKILLRFNFIDKTKIKWKKYLIKNYNYLICQTKEGILFEYINTDDREEINIIKDYYFGIGQINYISRNAAFEEKINYYIKHHNQLKNNINCKITGFFLNQELISEIIK